MNMPDYVLYTDAIETPEPDEGQTIAELIQTLKSISRRTFEDSGRPLRSVHAKSHALLRGELVVLDGLPQPLQQGLFALPGRYQVVMRLSTSPGDWLPDSVSTPRGLAVKVLGVNGERLPGSEADTTQDFVLVDGPAFQVSTIKAFLGSLKTLAKTTDRAEGFKRFASAVFRGTEKMLEAVGGESATLKSMGGHAPSHPLGETYYSQVPIRYGSHVAKLSIAPLSPELQSLTGAPVDVDRSPTALREAIAAYFERHGGQWEVRVQLCTDLATMPVEDAAAVWPEDRSPYRAVARITVPSQPSWTAERAAVVDDALAFSPWHGLAAHRPMGAVMRARKATYEASVQSRAEHRGCPIHEPRSAGEIPS